MKTSELHGAALDWAVAQCEGADFFALMGWDDDRLCYLTEWGEDFEPSTNWAQGGAIIERERVGLHYGDGTWGVNAGRWEANHPGCLYVEGGDTPLVAAMRCYVASCLGDEVQLPEELQ